MMATPEAGAATVPHPDESPIDIHEAAKLVGCSPELIRKLARNGDLRGWRIGTSVKSEWRFRRSDVMAYIERQMNTPAEGGEGGAA